MALRIPIPDDEVIAEYSTGELHRFLGELERARYQMAGVEKRIMEELDSRE